MIQIFWPNFFLICYGEAPAAGDQIHQAESAGRDTFDGASTFFGLISYARFPNPSTTWTIGQQNQ